MTTPLPARHLTLAAALLLGAAAPEARAQQLAPAERQGVELRAPTKRGAPVRLAAEPVRAIRPMRGAMLGGEGRGDTRTAALLRALDDALRSYFALTDVAEHVPSSSFAQMSLGNVELRSLRRRLDDTTGAPRLPGAPVEYTVHIVVTVDSAYSARLVLREKVVRDSVTPVYTLRERGSRAALTGALQRAGVKTIVDTSATGYAAAVEVPRRLRGPARPPVAKPMDMRPEVRRPTG